MQRATIFPTRAPVLNRVGSNPSSRRPSAVWAIDDAQDGFDLLVFEVLHGAAAGPRERDGEDALRGPSRDVGGHGHESPRRPSR